jgi:hypothetical protein
MSGSEVRVDGDGAGRAEPSSSVGQQRGARPHPGDD